ncbi:CD63 antigen-like [Amphiura filiformis]|uniref:CD63 antigen-like n=1 Tax=Amphiura filiformis TaxID=82378 RepID=UPI003B222A96
MPSNLYETFSVLDFKSCCKDGHPLTGIGLLVTVIYMYLGFLSGTYAVFLSGVPYLYVAYVLIGFYFLIVGVICVEVSIIIIAFAGLNLQDEVHSYIQESTHKEMVVYNHDDNEDFTKAWDTLQQEEKCCGFDRPNDWFQYAGKTFGVGDTPDSCCKIYQVGCGRSGNDYRFKEGCGDAIMDTVNHGLQVIGSVCVGFVFLQVILIVYILILYYLLRFGVKQRCCSAGVYDTD